MQNSDPRRCSRLGVRDWSVWGCLDGDFRGHHPRSTFGNGINDSIESTQSPLLRDPTQSDEIESETQRESEGEGEGEGESEGERPAKKPRRVSLADRGFVVVNKRKAPVQPSSGPSQ